MSQEVEIEGASAPICDPCSGDDIETKAVKFCTDCQESLCEHCADSHRKFKLFKGHTLLKSGKGQANQMRTLNMDIKCKSHKDKDVEMYCTTHDTFCCLICLKITHWGCTGVREIKDMGDTSRDILALLKQKYELIEKGLERVSSAHEETISQLSDAIEKTQHAFELRKANILMRIDDLQKVFELKTKQLLQSTGTSLESNTTRIKALQVRCHENIDKVNSLNEYELPLHKVVLQKAMLEEYIQIEKEMDSGELNAVELDVEWGALARLADIDREILACKDESLNTIKLQSKGMRSEDVLNEMKGRPVVKTKEYGTAMVNDSSPTYTSIFMTQDLRLLLSDNCPQSMSGCIRFYDPKEKSISKLKINKPFAAIQLKSNQYHIAVSVPSERQIQIATNRSNRPVIFQSLDTGKAPYSMVNLNSGHLGITWDSPPSFDIVDVSGNEIQTVRSFTQDSAGRKFKSFQYVAVDELRSHIIQPCTVNHTVYCFDYLGNPVFEYRHAELQEPRGVDIDRDGNIYVCSNAANCIHVLSPFGRNVKIIKEGVPLFPLAIRFDETREMFWVTRSGIHNREKVCLFSCQN